MWKWKSESIGLQQQDRFIAEIVYQLNLPNICRFQQLKCEGLLLTHFVLEKTSNVKTRNWVWAKHLSYYYRTMDWQIIRLTDLLIRKIIIFCSFCANSPEWSIQNNDLSSTALFGIKLNSFPFFKVVNLNQNLCKKKKVKRCINSDLLFFSTLKSLPWLKHFPLLSEH